MNAIEAIRLPAAYTYSAPASSADHTSQLEWSNTIAPLVRAITGTPSNQATQFAAGLRSTTSTASSATTTPNAPNSTRPLSLPTING